MIINVKDLSIDKIDFVLLGKVAQEVIGLIKVRKGDNLASDVVVEAIVAGGVDHTVTNEMRRCHLIGNLLFQFKRTINALITDLRQIGLTLDSIKKKTSTLECD